jgi:hypothetical protein
MRHDHVRPVDDVLIPCADSIRAGKASRAGRTATRGTGATSIGQPKSGPKEARTDSRILTSSSARRVTAAGGMCGDGCYQHAERIYCWPGMRINGGTRSYHMPHTSHAPCCGSRSIGRTWSRAWPSLHTTVCRTPDQPHTERNAKRTEPDEVRHVAGSSRRGMVSTVCASGGSAR